MDYHPSLIRFFFCSCALHVAAISGANGFLLKPANVNFPSDRDALLLQLSNREIRIEEPLPPDITTAKTHSAAERKNTGATTRKLPTQDQHPHLADQIYQPAPETLRRNTNRSPATGLGKEKPTVASLITSPKPPYPPAARRAGFEGSVLLEAIVLASGYVGSVQLLSSSGRNDCDNSALSTVEKNWRFKPATLLGAARESKVEIKIIFNLDEQ